MKKLLLTGIAALFLSTGQCFRSRHGKMAARLGQVLYWMFCILAALLLMYVWDAALQDAAKPLGRRAELQDVVEFIDTMFLDAIPSLVLYTIGRACR